MSQSSSDNNLSLYSDFFTPNNDTQNSDDCVIMTIIDRELHWQDIDCMATSYLGNVIVPICQCKGGDFPQQTTIALDTTPSAATTDTPLVCKDDWIDAGDMGCIQFMPSGRGLTMEEAEAL